MKNIFVTTQNVRNFQVAMTEAARVQGDPALLAFHGQAGRGKTSAARHFAAQEGWVYCRAKELWTALWMLQDLCFEVQVDPVPGVTKRAFEAVRDALTRAPRPVILDEADKLGPTLLEVVRDLADLTFAPFALVGEKRIKIKMQRERRMWSRTLRAVAFGPITAKDIMFFAKQAADLALSAPQAQMLQESSEGDFRLVARDVRRLEELLQANPGSGVTDEMVKTAVRQGFRGK